MEWLSWSDLSPELLYEVLRFRQDIFVVEQRCAYSELDKKSLEDAMDSFFERK